ncbi:DUF4333 domain-containing protein [Nocardia brevicatena]|uniref:DUF4333 domain-containing protein n=1 Tax=Nocardia brevicatena TaxID=37327 RepID=UPI0002FE1F88|nr:DUF4333 domain-containing protein [Nocardia brevicatena]
MSGPYGPNDAPNPGEGRNDPTQVWGGQQAPGGAGHNPGATGPAHPGGADPAQQWGGQQPFAQQPDPQQAQPTQKWGDQGGHQQWGQPQAQWGGQQPSQPQPQWGDQQPSQPQWQPQQQQQWGQQPHQEGGQPQHQQSQEWGQPQAQWGQQPQQQWGAQPGPSQDGGKKTGLIVGLAVLALAVVGGVVALILMLTAKDELDQNALQSGVQKVLSESYGIEDISDVTCPSGQQVQVDATFTCELKVGGEAKTVNIKITKDDGTYEVGRPS